MSRARRIAVIGLAAALLVVGAVAAAALLIPGERVAAAIAARAEALLGQRVTLGDVRLHFLPLPGVRLSDLVVGGSGEEDALAAADAVEVRARLLPLLRGQVIIGSLALEHPRLLVEIDTAGRTNIPILAGDSAAAAPPPARDVSFAIERLTVSGGRITLRDRRDGSEVRLDGWDQHLRLAGDIRGGRLGSVDLVGWVEFEDIDASLPRVVIPVRDLAVRVTHDATLDRAADRVELRTLGVIAADIALTGSGRVDSASSATGRSAVLGLRAEGFDATRLIRLAPDSLRARLALPDGRRLEPLGTATVAIDVNGPLTATALPRFDGVLKLADAGLRAGDVSFAEHVRGEAVFSADSAVLRAGGGLLGERFSLAVAVREPAAPIAVVAFNGRADLARLRPLGVLPDTLDLSGFIRAEMRALIPSRDLSAARLVGTAELSGIRLHGRSPGVAVTSGTLTFEGQRLRLDPFRARIGDVADIGLRAQVDGWIEAVTDSTAAPPRIAAEITADTLDLDRLLGPPEGEYPALLFARLRDRPLEDGRSADEAARSAGMALPDLPAVNAEARFRAARVIRNAMAYEAVDATVRVRPDSLELLAATFRLMGGTVRASGALVPTGRDSAGALERARLTATYALADVGAAPFFDRLTPFRDHLSGELAMAGSVIMDLDRVALPDRATVASDGSIAISDGRLANWRVLQAAGLRLGLTALDTVRFRDWAGAFRVTGPLVTLEETALDGPEVSARAAGSFDFSGRLDLGATVFLSRQLAARAGAVGEQLVATAGNDGRVPVGLRITGTADSPDVTLDLSAARGNVVARARETAEREAREVAAHAADAALDRLEIPDSLRGLPADSLRKVIGDSLFDLLPDSLRLPSDSLRANAEEALKRRLRSLFGGG
ncbi:MAG: AsmA family protein [Gemmatimonadetes bacterium]|nr:AsmA family protein [Gemmatimonadota bacterium]